MENIDRNLLHQLGFVSKEEQKNLMNIFNKSSREPSVQIATAMFRDTLVFRDLINSKIVMFNEEIHELHKRINELEDKINSLENEK